MDESKQPMRATIGILLLILAGCATTETQHAYVPGESLVNGSDPRLVKDVLYVLRFYEEALAPECKLKVVDTRLIELPTNVRIERKTELVVAKWSERWVLDRCGSNVAYRIDFDAQGSRGTDIAARIESAALTNGVEEIRIK
jgi:hypothetical protein